jgi:hypothetical protein
MLPSAAKSNNKDSGEEAGMWRKGFHAPVRGQEALVRALSEIRQKVTNVVAYEISADGRTLVFLTPAGAGELALDPIGGHLVLHTAADPRGMPLLFRKVRSFKVTSVLPNLLQLHITLKAPATEPITEEIYLRGFVAGSDYWNAP